MLVHSTRVLKVIAWEERYATAVLERAGVNTAATVAAAAFTGLDGAGAGARAGAGAGAGAALASSTRPGGGGSHGHAIRGVGGSSFMTPPTSPSIVYHGGGDDTPSGRGQPL
jgi:hypothetical protein